MSEILYESGRFFVQLKTAMRVDGRGKRECEEKPAFGAHAERGWSRRPMMGIQVSGAGLQIFCDICLNLTTTDISVIIKV